MNTSVAFILFGIALVSAFSSTTTWASTRVQLADETSLKDFAARLSAGGTSHTCLVRPEGSVACWGENSSGQLGDGTTTDRLTPVTVSGLTSAVAVAAGDIHTCAFLANGSARCWGANSSGQLGDGTTTDRLTPVAVSGLSNAVAIASKHLHTCALLANGSVRCWGANSSGQLGDGTTTARLTPTAVSGLTNVLAVATGDLHSCALRADGGVRCWGENSSGRLGDGTTTDRLTPVAVSALTNVVVIAAGRDYTCALRVETTLTGIRCWGGNSFGQLGDGTTTDRLTPVAVGGSGLNNATAVTAGDLHTCALLGDGTARCWGINGGGQLGDGTTVNRLLPVTVSGLTDAVAVAGGGSHTCALIAGGTAQCWGRNFSGQLGDGTELQRNTPTLVSGVSGNISGRGITGGGLHTCAVRADGSGSCWGENRSGQLGSGNFIDRFFPESVDDLANAVAVAAGGNHSCALVGDGSVSCWGANQNGQLGNGSAVDSNIPVSVINLPAAVKTIGIVTGALHSCALVADGRVICWGRNVVGQLGDGSTIDRSSPLFPVVGINNAKAVTAGGSYTCALLTDGTVRCWGNNVFGQLGDGTTTQRNIPAIVIGLTNAVAIAAGGQHTCALLADGTGRCWGANFAGQLGNGSANLGPTSLPVAVSGLANAIAIAAGGDHTCALLAGGGARCWGENAFGQIGDGTTTQRLLPTTVTILVPFAQVGGTTFFQEAPLGNILEVTAGENHTCALSANGGVQCWGNNDSGQLGDGTTTDRLRPVTVPSFTLNIDPVVALEGKTRVATVNILAVCEEGQHLHVDVALRQGSASGHGVGQGDCTGALESYPAIVPAQGRNTFLAGPAQVEAEAVIRERGLVVDEQEWTRQVDVVNLP